MTELQALILALRGGYEVVKGLNRRLDQMEADGVIDSQQRDRIDQEAQATDDQVDDLIERAKQSIGES